jgi:hypothetical protein
MQREQHELGGDRRQRRADQRGAPVAEPQSSGMQHRPQDEAGEVETEPAVFEGGAHQVPGERGRIDPERERRMEELHRVLDLVGRKPQVRPPAGMPGAMRGEHIRRDRRREAGGKHRRQAVAHQPEERHQHAGGGRLVGAGQHTEHKRDDPRQYLAAIDQQESGEHQRAGHQVRCLGHRQRRESGHQQQRHHGRPEIEHAN